MAEVLFVIQTPSVKQLIWFTQIQMLTYMVMNGPGIGKFWYAAKVGPKEIRQTGSYVSAGEYYAKVLEHVAQSYDKVNVAGHSLGARVATG